MLVALSFFAVMHSHCMAYHDQDVSYTAPFCKAFSLNYIILWPTVCNWHCLFTWYHSYHILSYGQQHVSLTALVLGNLTTPPCICMVDRMLVSLPYFCQDTHNIFSNDQQDVSNTTPLSARLYHHHDILLYEQQYVSDAALFLTWSFITSCFMGYSMWVTLLQEVWSHLIPSPTASGWHCPFPLLQSLIRSDFITNRKWVMLPFLCLSHNMLSHNQQHVSDTTFHLTCSLITHYPMTNSMFVILPSFLAGSLITSPALTTASK